MPHTVVLLGTLDTKGEEYRFVRDRLHAAGLETLVVDVGVVGDPAFAPDVDRHAVARAGGGDADEIKRIEDNGQVVFRYVGVNPNGSIDDIAGVSNERGNVVGLMPHPEHAVEPGFGPDTSAAMRSGVDGLTLFRSALESVLSV